MTRFPRLASPQLLGEACGWVDAIVAAGSIAKAANVTLMGHQVLRSGQVSVAVPCDVSVVKAAMPSAICRARAGQAVAWKCVTAAAAGEDQDEDLAEHHPSQCRGRRKPPLKMILSIYRVKLAGSTMGVPVVCLADQQGTAHVK